MRPWLLCVNWRNEEAIWKASCWGCDKGSCGTASCSHKNMKRYQRRQYHGNCHCHLIFWTIETRISVRHQIWNKHVWSGRLPKVWVTFELWVQKSMSNYYIVKLYLWYWLLYILRDGLSQTNVNSTVNNQNHQQSLFFKERRKEVIFNLFLRQEEYSTLWLNR